MLVRCMYVGKNFTISTKKDSINFLLKKIKAKKQKIQKTFKLMILEFDEIKDQRRK